MHFIFHDVSSEEGGWGKHRIEYRNSIDFYDFLREKYRLYFRIFGTIFILFFNFLSKKRQEEKTREFIIPPRLSIIC